MFFRKNLQDVAPRLAKELAWLKLSIFTHTPTAWLSQRAAHGLKVEVRWALRKGLKD
jgi:hypothetical protein